MTASLRPAQRSISFIIPAHNSTDVIENTLKRLEERLRGSQAEIIVVENGSDDGTPELLKQLAAQWPADSDTSLVMTHSEKGMGNALRRGIEMSHGAHIILTADDLPFGFSDLAEWEQLDSATLIAVGSKAHPESRLERTFSRQVMTACFHLLRMISLRMRTRDPQGTFYINGEFARGLAPGLQEPGYLLTSEIAYAAELARVRPTEVPITFLSADNTHKSRIAISDVIDMTRGLFRLRSRRKLLKAQVESAMAQCALVTR